MALVPANLDYTDRDFDAIRVRLHALIRSVFPEWTDFNVANFGNILLELFGWVGDVLGFYQDGQARESRISTATQRKNILALVKLIGYRAQGARAAAVEETFTLAEMAEADVTLPKGTKVSTADVTDAVSFQLLEDLVIPAGTTSATVTVENSESFVRTFVSSGLPNQSFVFPDSPYVDDSAIVSADNGDYTQVENFLDSTSGDRHFTVSVDQNDRASVKFGNGTNGAIPAGTITIEAKTGGGEKGNVEPDSINRIDGGISDGFGNPVILTVTNAARAEGGRARQGNAEIQRRAPESLRALTRSVGREDFEIHTLKLSGVARALMTTSNEDAGVPENAGILYVIPTGGGLPTRALKDQALAQVTVAFPATLTFKVLVQDPVYKLHDVTATLYWRAGVKPAKGAAAVRKALADFFAVTNADGSPNENVDFGFNYKDADGNPAGAMSYSDIFNVVRDVPEVRKIGGRPSDFVINGAHLDPPLVAREFPKLGVVRITDGDTGATL